MTYTVSSGTLNPSIPYHTIPYPGRRALNTTAWQPRTKWWSIVQDSFR